MELTMLAETLRNLIDTHQTTVVELAEYSGYGRTTIYDWLSGIPRMPADAVQSWIKHHKSDAVRAALISAMTGGLVTVTFGRPSAEDMDLNRDGVADLSDAIDATVEAQALSIGYLKEVRHAHQNGVLTRELAVRIAQARAQVVASWQIVDAILAAEIARMDSRKPASLKVG